MPLVKRSRTYPEIHEGVTLTQMLLPAPPPGTEERLAWCMHKVGNVIPYKQRILLFAPSFDYNFKDFVRNVPSDRAFWPILWHLHKLWFWTLLDVVFCIFKRP